MNRLGFIHDILDVKCLILFIMARINYPPTDQQIYELCYQDDCLSYFDVFTAIPQLVETGHLIKKEDNTYDITEKGRANGSLMEDSIAYSVRIKAEDAVNRYNRRIRRGSSVKTQIVQKEDSDCTVILSLSNGGEDLMSIELSAPNQRQAVRLTRLFENKAERLYNLVMTELLDNESEIDE